MTEPQLYKLGALQLTPEEMAAIDRLDRVLGPSALSSPDPSATNPATFGAIGGATIGTMLGSQSLAPKLTAARAVGQQRFNERFRPDRAWEWSSTAKSTGGKGDKVDLERSPMARRFDQALGRKGLASEGGVDAAADAVRDFIRRDVGVEPGGGIYQQLSRNTPWLERQRLLNELLGGADDAPMAAVDPAESAALKKLRDMRVVGGAKGKGPVPGPGSNELLRAFGQRLMSNHPMQRKVFLPRVPGKPSFGEIAKMLAGRARKPGAFGLIGAGVGALGGALASKALNSDFAEGIGRRLESLVPSAGSNRGSFSLDDVRRALGITPG